MKGKGLKRLPIIVILIWVIIVLGVGCNSSTPSTLSTVVTTSAKTLQVVRISQDIINEAIEECKDKDSWGIALALVRINYRVGVNVAAAVVLHNGSDTAKFVTIECDPTFVTSEDSENGITYSPSPLLIKSWLRPEIKTLRLEKMETRVVNVNLAIPEGIKNLPKYWEAHINVNGVPINYYDQKMLVETVDNDNILTFHATYPLLEGLKSVLSIKSDLDEEIKVVDYNPETGIVTAEGLLSNQKRYVVVNYEYGSPITVAYNQRWLITMLKD